MFWKTHHARSLENCADGDLARRIQFLLQGAHRFVVGAGQPGIESEFARTVLTVVKSNDDICPPARDIFINRLADARLELNQIARQIDHDVALFPVHGI